MKGKVTRGGRRRALPCLPSLVSPTLSAHLPPYSSPSKFLCRWGWFWTSPTAPGSTALRRSCPTRRKGRYFTARSASPGVGSAGRGGLILQGAQGRAGGAWSGVCREILCRKMCGPGGGSAGGLLPLGAQGGESMVWECREISHSPAPSLQRCPAGAEASRQAPRQSTRQCMRYGATFHSGPTDTCWSTALTGSIGRVGAGGEGGAASLDNVGCGYRGGCSGERGMRATEKASVFGCGRCLSRPTTSPAPPLPSHRHYLPCPPSSPAPPGLIVADCVRPPPQVT